MKKRICLSLAHMGGNEQKYIKEAFDSNWVAPLGPNVNGFESDLRNYLGSEKSVVALSSGTAAIHLALVELGITIGDDVICQSFTFVGSANPIVYLGGNPIFVDSEKDTWNMSPVFLEEAILDRIIKTRKKPKAIIVVHLFGMPSKMDQITEISKRYDIPIIEDAAEALGSRFKNRKCGILGDFGILSFNGNKIITTSGGGALVCSNDKEAKKIVFLATQARDEAPYYQHTQIGYNYRLSNICAGIGRGQMEVLPQRIERRRNINTIYRNRLSNIDGITFQTEPNKDFFSNYWLTSIIIDPEKTNGVTKENIRLACEAEGVETRSLWKPMHLQPIFADTPFYGDGTCEMLFNNGLCLPSGTTLTNEQINFVADIVKMCIVDEYCMEIAI